MNARSSSTRSIRSWVRVISGLAWGVLAAGYLGAKLHFFSRFDAHEVGNYVREHSAYWIWMAIAAFLIWLLSGTDQGSDRESPSGS
jgi:hypothetical protein